MDPEIKKAVEAQMQAAAAVHGKTEMALSSLRFDRDLTKEEMRAVRDHLMERGFVVEHRSGNLNDQGWFVRW